MLPPHAAAGLAVAVLAVGAGVSQLGPGLQRPSSWAPDSPWALLVSAAALASCAWMAARQSSEGPVTATALLLHLLTAGAALLLPALAASWLFPAGGLLAAAVKGLVAVTLRPLLLRGILVVTTGALAAAARRQVLLGASLGPPQPDPATAPGSVAGYLSRSPLRLWPRLWVSEAGTSSSASTEAGGTPRLLVGGGPEAGPQPWLPLGSLSATPNLSATLTPRPSPGPEQLTSSTAALDAATGGQPPTSSAAALQSRAVARPAGPAQASAAPDPPPSAPVAPRPSVLYRSNLRTVVSSCKVHLAPGADFHAAAGSLSAAARTAAARALLQHSRRGGGAAPAGPLGGEQEGAPGGGGRPPPPPFRLQLAALRGCVELVFRMQFDGEELDEEAIAAIMAEAEAEARAAGAGAGNSEAAAQQGGQGGGLTVAPAVWSSSHPPPPPRPAAAPSPDGGSSGSEVSSPFVMPPELQPEATARGRGAVAPAGALPEVEQTSARLRRQLPVPTRAVQLLVALDPPVVTAGTGSGGSGGALQVFLCIDEGHALPDGVEVRLVVEQRGAVVAEVARVSVGPQGGNTSLDVSGLAEGSAALLVLPVWEEGPRMRPTRAPGLLYVPLAVVPAPVAEELSGLLRSMEHEADRAWRDAKPTTRRARAYAHHFSTLISDVASLLPTGGTQAVAGAQQDEPWQRAGGAQEAARVAPGSGLEVVLDMSSAASAVSRAAADFLLSMGLTDTLGYLAAGPRDAAGVQGPGRTGQAGAVPAQTNSDAWRRGADEITAADAAPAVAESGVPRPAAVEAAAESSGRVEGGPEALGELAAKRHASGKAADADAGRMRRQQLALAGSAVFRGFRDTGTERRCYKYRVQQAYAHDPAIAVLNAILTLGTLAAVAAWHGDAAALTTALMPGWALAPLVMCVCALVLPAVSFRAFKRLSEPRTREPLVWVCHAVSMALLCRHVLAWGHGAAGGPVATAAPLAAPAGRALAASCAALQPTTYGLHLRSYGPLFALDAALLTLMFSAADGGAWLSGLAPAAGVVAASTVASVLVDLYWRLRFLRELSREVGRSGAGTGGRAGG
ncbi:hypothetical protein HYH03_016543 [Edaphochlamys debaryana]|uniref:Uncharacterized protein n=1 Tax=Edaphochlamys debaryana TaxID=47281 RepID=A0A835XPL9_9CHLO|nr:hypothetical protein HYH03_016543 [Edaphochlamys debaryana]|eukprot:KAG2484715.1 hypothetical protein HYH03_016543 [Edaphochlamys debaryana]